MANDLLITPTLLDSFEFALGAPPSWKDRAMTQFIQKIRREKTDMPAWVWKGIDFENAVYKFCKKAAAKGEDKVTQGSKHFQKVANACMGGEFQKVAKKELRIDGEMFRMWGKMDVLFPEKIVDLKTTLKYKPQKYYNGWQPPLYCWARGIKEFKFIVAEWVDEESNDIFDVHEDVTLSYNDFDALEKQIVKGVRKMVSFLHEKDLYDDYYFTFSNNKR